MCTGDRQPKRRVQGFRRGPRGHDIEYYSCLQLLHEVWSPCRKKRSRSGSCSLSHMHYKQTRSRSTTPSIRDPSSAHSKESNPDTRLAQRPPQDLKQSESEQLLSSPKSQLSVLV